MTPEQIYETFGANLRRQREAAGHTQQTFAELTGFSRTSISNIETGRQRILLENVYEFATKLEIPVQSLLPELLKSSPTDELPAVNLNEEQSAFVKQILS